MQAFLTHKDKTPLWNYYSVCVCLCVCVEEGEITGEALAFSMWWANYLPGYCNDRLQLVMEETVFDSGRSV